MQRLTVLAESSDGFRIAEKDLEFRGPGEFLGTKQSGLPEIRIGNIIRDVALLEKARGEALRILELIRERPSTAQRTYGPLIDHMKRQWGERLGFMDVG
jgi:ATP-dependent DNA helicase RecG